MEKDFQQLLPDEEYGESVPQQKVTNDRRYHNLSKKPPKLFDSTTNPTAQYDSASIIEEGIGNLQLPRSRLQSRQTSKSTAASAHVSQMPMLKSHRKPVCKQLPQMEETSEIGLASSLHKGIGRVKERYNRTRNTKSSQPLPSVGLASMPFVRKEATDQTGESVGTQKNIHGKPFRKQNKHSTHNQPPFQPRGKKPTVVRERWNIQSMPMGELKSLCKVRESSELVDRLFDRLKSFQRTLQLSNKLNENGIMDAIIYILMRVSECLKTDGIPSEQSESQSRACQILGEVVSSRCADFQFRLSIYVKRDLVDRSTVRQTSQRQHPPMIPFSYCSSHAKATSVCTLFRSLLETIPESSWSVLPVNELVSFIRSSPSLHDLLYEAENILLLHDEMREQTKSAHKKKHLQIKADWDNSEYREEQILPEWEEVCLADPPNRLRPNIISDSYTDWMHYYDVQFRLLREDFIAPLRRGICEYIDGIRGRKLQNVKVYNNVTLCEPLFTKESVCYEVEFDVSRLQRCRWEHSKRLLFGSLLCISPDDFEKTIFFATVANREPEELKKGKLQIRFEGEGTKMLAFCNKSTVFTMVESMAYFEASRHILHSLQTAEVATMPFTQYLVQNQCETVSMPKYLNNEPVVEYDLSCLQGNKESPFTLQRSSFFFEESSRSSPRLTFDIKNSYQWPSSDKVELDKTQLEAIQMALTQEIAVIQGPPGTGKTYVGLKIVEALLRNRNVWDREKESPIVVMCLTNHALDQFLEGIVKQSNVPKIVRIGGRCQSESIQQFSIDKIRRRVHIPEEIFSYMKDCKVAVSSASDDILQNSLKTYFRAKISYLPLQKLSDDKNVSLQHHYQLFERIESPEERHLALELWLEMFEIYEEHALSESNPNVVNENGTAGRNQNLDKANGEGNGLANKQEVTVPEDIRLQEQNTNYTEQNTANTDEDSTSGPSNVEAAEEGSVEDEELIDIHGEATIEQGARVSTDNKFRAKRFEHSQLVVGHFSAAEQEISTAVPKASNTISGFGYQNEATAFSSVNEETTSNWDPNHETDEGFGSRYDHFTQSDYENEEDDDEVELRKVPKYVKIRRIIRRFDIVDFVELGRQYPPMTPHEANNVTNIHDLPTIDRWRLYNYWVSLYIQQYTEIVEEKLKEYDGLCKKSLQARRQADRFALETAEVIGMTTTGAAKYQHILHLVKPRIVIVEEAAEVLESHIVSALNAGTQHLILIGDHKQLRPKPNDYDLARKYHLDVSLFERLVRNNFPHATLQIQHRMRPEIAQLVKPHIYRTLTNHHSVEEYDSVVGVEKNLYFIQHEFPEAEDEHLISHSNQHEAQFLAALCKYLLQQGYKPSQITILVTYAGQLLKMRACMPKKIFEGVRVCTVDNFQGEENDIIFLSLVRSNDIGKIGFLKEENRVCVALSRAKMGFYCIGNIKMLRQNAPIWDIIMSDIETKGYLGDSLPLGCAMHPSKKFLAKLSEDFAKNAPEGGCLQDCMYRLPCGHVCTLKCHIVDPQHEAYECKKPCPKSCPKGHPCPLKCHEECKSCRTYVRKLMPYCGHTQRMKCHEDPNSVLCSSDCENKCDNGHPCPKRCSEVCGVCEKVVVKTIPTCGHKVNLLCYIAPLHKECTEPCEKLLPFCGHPCKRLCGQVCLASFCKVQVDKLLKCGHKMKVSCKTSTQEFTCDKQCEKKLNPCGHPCKEKCSQPCTTKCMVQVNKTWPCGHKLKRKCYQTQNPLDYPCEKKCDRKLPCGHSCPRKCGEDCAKFTCVATIDKLLPCGHIQKISCSTTDDPPCKMHCTYILACGHRCEGECSKCNSSRVHVPCKYGVDSEHFCGHKIVVPCLDLNDSHSGKQKRCIAYCPHKKCSDTHDCSTPCTPCTEPCTWNCSHHQCNKLCHEVCERPQCNERCENRLKCGHRCYGLCGEPCLTFCPECKRRDFNKHFKEEQSNFDPTNLYVQLECGHIFSVYSMDLFTRQNDVEASRIAPLQCPTCKHPLCSSNRYGNAVKRSLQDVNAVRDTISTTKELCQVSPGDLHPIVKRLQTVLDNDMQEKECNPSLELNYHRLKKAGWSTTTKHWVSAAIILYRYKPIPRRTEDLKKLKEQLDHHAGNVSNQELYVLHFLVSTLELLSISVAEDLKSIPLSDILCTCDINKQLVTFANTLFTLRKEKRSRLSVQLTLDLKSEFYYLSLIVQHCLVKKAEKVTIHASFRSESDEFLSACAQKPLLQVKAIDYTRHTTSFSDRYEQINATAFPSCFLRFDRYYHNPPVLKGTWWKCPKGHYFCMPITMANDIKAMCPQCGGTTKTK